MYLVSGCLCGLNCKYNGKNNLNPIIKKLYDEKKCIAICPETFGGLKSPRVPSEIINGRVYSKDLKDLTNEFILGAKKSLEIAKNNDIELVILKDGSPSCGVNYIYDGNFNGTKIKGMGICCKMLVDEGYKVISENEVSEIQF